MDASEQGFGCLGDKHHADGRHVTPPRGLRSPSPFLPERCLLMPFATSKGIGPPGMLVSPIKELVGEAIAVIDDACFAC